MLSLNDIINVGFRKTKFSGYNTDDVDDFVDKVRESYDALLKKCASEEEAAEQLKAEDQQNREKLKILADKIEEYRAQEDEIKNALISAQKLSDASIREARHKGEIIVKDAELKAEHISADAEEKIVDQKKELERLKKAVSDFRTKLLGIYKEHLTLIDALPTYRPEPKREPAPQPEPQSVPQPEPVPQPELRAKETPAPEAALQQPAEEKLPRRSEEAPSTPEISNFDD